MIAWGTGLTAGSPARVAAKMPRLAGFSRPGIGPNGLPGIVLR